MANAGMDPLKHYLLFGAHEGRQSTFDATSPYSFSGANVSQGAGQTGNGTFGFSGITSSAAPPSIAAPPAQPSGSDVSNPYGFSGMNAGTYSAPSSPTTGGNLDVDFSSGASNGLQGSGGAGGSAFGYTDPDGNAQVATFNPDASELAYLRGQMDQVNQQTAAGQSINASNPNTWNAGLANTGQQIQSGLITGLNPAVQPASAVGASQPTGINFGIGTTPFAIPTAPLPGGLFGTVAFNPGPRFF